MVEARQSWGAKELKGRLRRDAGRGEAKRMEQTVAGPKSKLALITGASGGIGEAFARLLAEEGHDLFIVARNDNELNRLSGVLSSRHQVRVTPLALDLSVPGAGKRVMKELKSRGLEPSLLINNAGFGLTGAATELSVDEQLNMIDLNVRALTDLTTRLLPGLIARGSGGIINVASVAGFVPGPYMAVYYASKAFVLSYGDALSAELEGTGVRVTTVCPGPVETGFQARAGSEGSRWMKLARMATAQDTAKAGWFAYGQGARVCVPGVGNKISATAGRLLPRAMVLPVMRFLQKPVATAKEAKHAKEAQETN